MSSTSYPCGTTKATIFQELKVSAKNRTDLHLSDTRVSGNTLWIGGMLTTHNARFYYVERHHITTHQGVCTLRSESVDMGLTDTCIPAPILKKLRAEWYWRRHDTVHNYIERCLSLQSARSHRKQAVQGLVQGDTLQYHNAVYRLDQNLGRKGWSATNVHTGDQCLLSKRSLNAAVKVSQRL